MHGVYLKTYESLIKIRIENSDILFDIDMNILVLRDKSRDFIINPLISTNSTNYALFHLLSDNSLHRTAA